MLMLVPELPASGIKLGTEIDHYEIQGDREFSA